MSAAGAGADLGPCPICGRPMIAGPSVDRHHWVPRRLGGTAWDWLHRLCHKKLHSLYDERTLARDLADPESARADPEIAKFIRWARKQPPEALGRHAAPKGRRRRR
ncbi:MAG: HNH endonuclease [Alphaproteobacteria bacterium]|nr:HNH endonuclease [Alphaproteobacteria bacterium]